MPASPNRPALSLADLEAHDPHAPAGERERRFLCPLPGMCAAKQRGVQHRSLAANMVTGAWKCHRCGAGGVLAERWEPPRVRQQSALRRAFALSAPPAPSGSERRPAATPAVDSAWKRQLVGSPRALVGTPAAGYLATRGIPETLADAAQARYAPKFYGRPAVVFPLRNVDGEIVAVQGRYLDGGKPKARTGGPLKRGLFATPGALDADPIVIMEAPIDVLSLAVCGFLAVALCGISAPDWLPAAVRGRRVFLAFDDDAGGEEGVSRLAGRLAAAGTMARRLRPTAGKDWNALLLEFGAAQLAAELRAVFSSTVQVPLAPPVVVSCSRCTRPTLHAHLCLFCQATDLGAIPLVA